MGPIVVIAKLFTHYQYTADPHHAVRYFDSAEWHRIMAMPPSVERDEIIADFAAELEAAVYYGETSC